MAWPLIVDRFTAKLMNHLTDKLVDRLTAKLVVVNFGESIFNQIYSIILYIYIHEWPSSGFVSCLYSYTKYYIKPKFVTASSSSSCPSSSWKGCTPWT